jgi:hypothetical protein
MDEQIYMALCMIKQGTNKKMEVYHGWNSNWQIVCKTRQMKACSPL